MAPRKTLTEAEWLAGESPAVLAHVRRVRSPRKKRLLYCGICRTLADQLPDDECRSALTAAERYADGDVTHQTILECIRSVDFTDWGPRTYTGPVYELKECLSIALRPDHTFALEYFEYYRSLQPVPLTVLRDIFPNPFRPVRFSRKWRTATAVGVADAMYQSRAFDRMPILADALEDAGCADESVLAHCRTPDQLHVRGCWVVDLVLGKS
jgi:hypothetical protein